MERLTETSTTTVNEAFSFTIYLEPGELDSASPGSYNVTFTGGTGGDSIQEVVTLNLVNDPVIVLTNPPSQIGRNSGKCSGRGDGFDQLCRVQFFDDSFKLGFQLYNSGFYDAND